MAENMDPKEKDNSNDSFKIADKTENSHSLNSKNISADDFQRFSKILTSTNRDEESTNYSDISRKDAELYDSYSGGVREEDEYDAESANNSKMPVGKNPGSGIENFNLHWLIIFAAVAIAIYFNLANGTSLEFALIRATYCAGIFWVIAELADFIIFKMK
jgi:hypothetical protein